MRIIVLFFLFSSFAFPQSHAVNMGDCSLAYRIDIAGAHNRYYILDKTQRRIFVFNNKKYLHSMGRPGQGPGEFQYPAALSVYKDGIYCIDKFSGYISEFDKYGKVRSYFKLQEEDNKIIGYIADFEVCDQGFLVAYDKGPFILKLYDQEGRFRKCLERKDNSYKSIAHVYDITIDENMKSAYVFSRFDSSLLIVSLPNLKILGSLKSFGTNREDQIKVVITSKSANSETSTHFNTYFMFFPLVTEDSKFIAIPNERGESKRFTATSVDISLKPESLKTFEIANDVPHRVTYIKKVGGKVLLVNDFGDLFIRNGLL